VLRTRAWTFAAAAILFASAAATTTSTATAAVGRSKTVTESSPAHFAVAMISEGDYILGGGSAHYNASNAVVGVSQSDGRLSVGVSGGTRDEDYGFLFATPEKQTRMTIGSYDRAQRFASGTHPGIDIDGEGRGCNETAGSFDVLDIHYRGAVVDRLHLTFEQHCDGELRALFGEIRIGPERDLDASPSTLAWPARTYLGETSAVAGVRVRPTQGSFVPNDISIVGAGRKAFAVRSTTCDTPVGVAGCLVNLKFVPQRHGPVTATLVVSGRVNGEQGRVRVALSAMAALGRTSWDLSGDDGDWVLNGAQRYLTPAGDGLKVTGDETGIRVMTDIGGNRFWDGFISPATGDILADGVYTNVARFPSGSNPQLDVSGEGHGCNETTGQFDVHDIAFSEVDSSVSRLVLTFTQHCEGADPALHGRVRFHASPDLRSPPPIFRVHVSHVGGRAELTWTNPGTSDFGGAVVRWYPGRSTAAGPQFGRGVERDSPTSAHFRLAPGHEATVTMFTYDTTGNVSPPTVARLPSGP
jgi:hypothetical protein